MKWYISPKKKHCGVFHLIFFHLNFTINFISKINLILNYQPHIVIILNRRYREISKFLYHICQKFGKLDHWMVRKNHNITKWESAIAQENASYVHFLKTLKQVKHRTWFVNSLFYLLSLAFTAHEYFITRIRSFSNLLIWGPYNRAWIAASRQPYFYLLRCLAAATI